MFEWKPDIVRLKEVLETSICYDHRQGPKIHLFDDVLTLDCCCPFFYNECRKLALDLNEVLAIENLEIKQRLKG